MLGTVARAQGLDASAKKQLLKVESKYFGHGFESDSEEARASRLEQLMFGESSTGNPEDRIKKILEISPTEDEPSKSSATTEKRSSKPGKTAAFIDADKIESRTSSLNEEESNELKDYPHVSALEKVILGRTFSGQALSARLSRIETKAFGKPTNIASTSQRIDALDQYVESKLQQNLYANNQESEIRALDSPAQNNANSENLQADAKQSDYPHIAALEKAILGQSYGAQPLSARLSRLETTAFGSSSNDPDLSKRTDALDRFVERKLHKKPAADNQVDTANSRTGTGGNGLASPATKQVLVTVANTLLGVAGMGVPGVGSAMGPLGRFGGLRFSPRQQAQADIPVTPDTEEDPAVFASVAPPNDARLQTKIGWCEQKVFGHTFSTLHLTDRLRQLSTELQYSTNKSDFELMDDIGGMIKTVQTRQARPIGSAAAPELH